MKASVNAALFYDAIKKASAVPVRSSIPMLEQVMVEMKNGICRLTGSNLEQYLTVELPAQGENFSFLFLNTAEVEKACKYFAGELLLDYTPKEKHSGRLTMQNGGRFCHLEVTDTEDYPALPVVEPEQTRRTNAAELLSRFKRVQYAVAKDTSRPVLTGAQFRDNQLIGIDGQRMAVNTDESLRVGKPFSLPVKPMRLLSIFGTSDVEIAVGKRWASITNANMCLYTRILEGEVFNADNAIPKTWREEHRLDKVQLIRELRYLGQFVRDERHHYIRFEDGVLSAATVKGRFRSSLVGFGQSDAVFAFDCSYMLDALSQFKNDDEILLRISNQVSPIVLTNGKGDLALVLPLKLRDVAQAA